MENLARFNRERMPYGDLVAHPCKALCPPVCPNSADRGGHRVTV